MFHLTFCRIAHFVSVHYKASNLLIDLAFSPKNWTDSGTHNIQVNPIKVYEEMGRPVYVPPMQQDSSNSLSSLTSYLFTDASGQPAHASHYYKHGRGQPDHKTSTKFELITMVVQ